MEISNARIERAQLLMGQSRYELAEQELQQLLAHEPEHTYAHALMALCLTEREQYAKATDAAQQAVRLAPDDPFVFYVLAQVLYDRDRLAEAERALDSAIQLDPYEPSFLALFAAIRFDQSKWSEALDFAQRGLSIDPEHVQCSNLRAMALTRLGRREEAGQTLDNALARDPENALTHANRGWTLLEKGQHRQAMTHFQEALRLDPEMDWAREGILEALRARNIIYRQILRYFFWMSTLSNRAQWGVILGAYFTYRVIRGVAKDNPDLAPYLLPLMVLYGAFVFVSWTARPLFNLLLRFNRFGRLALTPTEIRQSNIIGAALVIAAATLAAWCYSSHSALLLAAMMCLLIVLPVSATFNAAEGWPRKVMTIYSSCLALLGIASAVGLVVGGDESLDSTSSPIVAASFVGVALFLIGIFIGTFGANFLLMVRPKK